MAYVIEIPQLAQFIRLLAIAPEKTKSELEGARDRASRRLRARERIETGSAGALRASITIIPEGSLGARIGPRGVSYAKFVHDGTRPHLILPRVKKALYWPGADHPVRRVNHPGTPPNPFAERTKQGEQGRVKEEYMRAGENILRSLKV